MNAHRFPRILPHALAAACLLGLAACAPAGDPAASAPADDAATPPAEARKDAPPPMTDGNMPPINPAPEQPVPPPGSTPDGDRDLSKWNGYGDLSFGMTPDAMKKAWGGELKTEGKEFNPGCYFMTPTWVKTPAEFNFMVGDGKFARYGVESAKLLAPGGGKVGMSKAEIVKLYAGRVEEQPHKYTDGQYLRIKDASGGNGVLIFETDGKGDGAKVTEWRVGVPPYSDYVEGCS